MSIRIGPEAMAWSRGWDAFGDGRPIDDASKEPPSLQDDWLEGWRDRQRLTDPPKERYGDVGDLHLSPAPAAEAENEADRD